MVIQTTGPALRCGLERTRPVDERAFRRTMSRFATCVAVTTTSGGAGPVGCTTTAMLSLSLRPPTLLVSLCSSGRTLDDLLSAAAFAVNVLSSAQYELVARFSTGDPRRRFEGVAHRLWDGVPVLDGCAATVVCDVAQAVPVLDHTLLVGTVRRVDTRPAAPLILLDGRSHRAEPTHAPLASHGEDKP